MCVMPISGVHFEQGYKMETVVIGWYGKAPLTSMLAYTHPHTGDCNDIDRNRPDTDTPTLPSLDPRNNDTVPGGHPSELTVYDTCAQSISEHVTSEEVVTTITMDTEGAETREVTHRRQRERSAEESSPPFGGYVAQATDQEGFFMADTSGECSL